MSSNKKALWLPVLTIVIGVGWLLSVLGITPEINWAWTLGLAAVGLLTFAVGGLDKITIIIAPLLLIGSGMSILRQTGRLSVDVEVPILVIITGILFLAAKSPRIPLPKWWVPEEPKTPSRP